MNMFYVYVLQSKSNNKFYTGLTRDIEKRLDEHNSGISKSTKGGIPFELVYYEFCLNYKDAMKREQYLKTTWGKRYIKNRIQYYIGKGIYLTGAEGSGSNSKIEFKNFLNIAKRSTFENANIVIILNKRNLMDNNTMDSILERLEILCRRITNFQKSLRK